MSPDEDAVPRRVLVTGGAAGIGAAIAARARAGGARVGVVDLAAPNPTDLAAGEVAVAADVSDPVAAAEAVETVAAGLGGVDVLVNNAGIAPSGRLEDTDLERWRTTMRVNLDGLFLVTTATLSHLRRSPHGPAIVTIGSIAGRTHSRTGSVAYATTKGGTIAFTRQLARELAPDGIRVNCVCPGLVDTEIMSRNVTPERLATLVADIPLGRLADPAEVAESVWFLASPAASYLTGSVVDVTGGLG